MDNLSRDVFGNVSFNKHLKENKSFLECKIKAYHNYNCIDYLILSECIRIKTHSLVDFKISLN